MALSLDEAVRDGLDRQAAAADALLSSGARRLGWKAGLSSPAAMARLSTSGPMVGFLTDATLAASGSRFDVSSWDNPVLEGEIAVELSADLEAGQNLADVEAAVGAVGAAIELVDLGELAGNVDEILASNIFHRRVLLGDLFPLGEGMSLSDLRIDVAVSGRDHAVAADPAALLGSLVVVLANMAKLLADSKDGLRKGDKIITGAAAEPLKLSGGEEVEVRVGGSRVSASIQGE